MAARTLRRQLLTLVGLGSIWAVRALAQGNMGLDEVMEAVKTAPQLIGQIEVEVRRRDLKIAGMVCMAASHGNEWRLLGGGRAAPYECRIGDLTLRIDAQRTYFDAQGRAWPRAGPYAPQQSEILPGTRFSLDLEPLRRKEQAWTPGCALCRRATRQCGSASSRATSSSTRQPSPRT